MGEPTKLTSQTAQFPILPGGSKGDYNVLTFPQLSSGAVAQYPVQKTQSYSTQILSFLDGSEQRYRIAAPLHRWVIQLDLLGESELNELNIFFTEAQGSFSNFAFTDPITATVYQSCYLEGDNLDSLYEDGSRCKTTLVVRENQGGLR